MKDEEVREIRRRHVEETFRPENFSPEDGFEQFKSAAHYAAMQASKELVERVLEEAAAAVEGERLSGETGEESDAAYNRAVEHASAAVRALKG